MEDYKKFIRKYRRKIKFIPKRRKTATPSASNNHAGFLRILKRKQNITRVSGKSTKDVTTYCQESAHHQELFRFVSAVLESEQLFLGLVFLSPHHLEALVLFAEL